MNKIKDEKVKKFFTDLYNQYSMLDDENDYLLYISIPFTQRDALRYSIAIIKEYGTEKGFEILENKAHELEQGSLNRLPIKGEKND